MVSRGAVMADEVAFEVIVDAEIEALEIFNMLKIHVDVIEIVFVQKPYDLPVKPGAPAQELPCHPVRIEYDDH